MGEMTMGLIKYALALVVLVSPIICGCGSNNQSVSAIQQSQQLISSLRQDLDNARKELETQIDLNRNLDDQVHSLTSKLDEIEKQSSVGSSRLDSPGGGSSAAFDSQSRVSLMGAKALAEFKAEQLSSKLEKMTKESQIREGDLAKALEQAEVLSTEYSKLKNALNETNERCDSQSTEKTDKINQMNIELKGLSNQVTELRENVAEKDELLVTLKKAWSDATQLKTAAESEVSQLKDELSRVNSQLASFRDAAERGSQEASMLKNELQQAQERLDSATAQLEKLTNENISSNTEIERLKKHSASLANKLYALERSAGVDSENFVTSVDRIIGGKFLGSSQETVTR